MRQQSFAIAQSILNDAHEMSRERSRRGTAEFEFRLQFRNLFAKRATSFCTAADPGSSFALAGSRRGGKGVRK
jgi:hypothetical protein